MGIHDLFKVFKDRCPDEIQDFHLHEWRGKSFAVDISIFLNKYIKSAGDRLWMNTFFMFLCTLKKHSIKCVAIFDGPNPPIEKQEEQQSRKDQSQKSVDRLNRSIEIRDLLLKDYIPKDVSVPDELQGECQKLLGYYAKTVTECVDDILEESIILVNRQKYKRNIDWSEATDIYDALRELIERLEKQTSPITNTQREKAWDIVKMMGIPTFQAEGEAEALCAYLAIYGYVDAVLTEDTDVLAYGTPWMLAFKDYKLGDEKVKGIHLPRVLDAMGYNMEEFRDLCILLSCDYNHRVKGYPPTKSGKPCKKAKSIGWVGAVAMIDEYRTLEECENYIDDIEPLKYQRCRELFTPITNDELLELIQTKPYTMKPNMDLIRGFILREKLTISIDYIEQCWKPIEIVIYSEEDSSEECNVEEHKSNIYVKLIATCENKNGKEKIISFNVMFRDEEHYREAEESQFDFYLDVFNEWINEWINEWNEGYHINDCVECDKIYKVKPEDEPILDVSDVNV